MMKKIDELVKLLEVKGIDAQDVDEDVHEAKACEAAAINNGGLDEQIEYLYEQLGEEWVRTRYELD
jgi:hypothetical protein